MRPRSRGRGAKRGWLAALLLVGTLALIGEVVLTLAIARDDDLLPADPAFAAAPPTVTVKPDDAVMAWLPRPRIQLELSRPGFWSSPAPTAAPKAGPRTAQEADSGPVTAAYLDNYLRQHDSPLTGMGQVFWDRGRQFDVDPRLLVAIAGNESGFGRILTSRHNAFSWFFRGMWDSDFDSWEQAIEVVARGIREHYLDEGRTSVALLGEKYGPIGAPNDPENLNVNFVPNVTAFLLQMGGDPNRLTFN